MQLRLLTYNVHKCVGTDRALDVDRVAEVVRHHAPDVVCFQEVLWAPDAGSVQQQHQRLAEVLGMRHGAVGLNCRRRMGVYGNVTLSRLPLETHENVDLTLRFKKPRGALYTRLAAGRTPFHVFNVHLGLARFERARQAADLLEHVHEVTGGDGPVVILGDTNDWRNRLAAVPFRARGYACANGNGDDPGHATFPSWYPIGALDKVFVNGGLRVVRAFPSRLALARVASDHLPVVADLEVPEL